MHFYKILKSCILSHLLHVIKNRKQIQPCYASLPLILTNFSIVNASLYSSELFPSFSSFFHSFVTKQPNYIILWDSCLLQLFQALEPFLFISFLQLRFLSAGIKNVILLYSHWLQ